MANDDTEKLKELRVLVGKKLSIDDLINLLGEDIIKYIKTEQLDELKKNAAQFVVAFNDDNTVNSLSVLRESDIIVDSPEEIFKIIDEMKKIKSEKGNISPGEALRSALRNVLKGTTTEQINEVTEAEQSHDKGEQTY